MIALDLLHPTHPETMWRLGFNFPKIRPPARPLLYKATAGVPFARTLFRAGNLDSYGSSKGDGPLTHLSMTSRDESLLTGLIVTAEAGTMPILSEGLNPLGEVDRLIAGGTVRHDYNGWNRRRDEGLFPREKRGRQKIMSGMCQRACERTAGPR